MKKLKEVREKYLNSEIKLEKWQIFAVFAMVYVVAGIIGWVYEFIFYFFNNGSRLKFKSSTAEQYYLSSIIEKDPKIYSANKGAIDKITKEFGELCTVNDNLRDTVRAIEYLQNNDMRLLDDMDDDFELRLASMKRLKEKTEKEIAILFSIVFLLGLVVVSGLRKGNKVILSKVEIESDQLPKSFDGYKILQISDIFSRELGNRQSKIKKLLEHEDYDIVIFTGDFVLDDTEEDYWVIRDLLSCLKEKTPIYYVVGDTDYKPGWVNDSSDRWKMCINPPEKTKFIRFFEENYVFELST